jgi:hypothetical protein
VVVVKNKAKKGNERRISDLRCDKLELRRKLQIVTDAAGTSALLAVFSAGSE